MGCLPACLFAWCRGEARGWPQTVKPRGVITDIAGFKKETYYLMRAWWLSAIASKDAGRPPIADSETTGERAADPYDRL
jgi:hypothetical protein